MKCYHYTKHYHPPLFHDHFPGDGGLSSPVGFPPFVMKWHRLAAIWSWSRDAPASRLGLGYLRLVAKTLFCLNFASHVNKMSQISSRYIMAVLTRIGNRSMYYLLTEVSG